MKQILSLTAIFILLAAIMAQEKPTSNEQQMELLTTVLTEDILNKILSYSEDLPTVLGQLACTSRATRALAEPLLAWHRELRLAYFKRDEDQQQTLQFLNTLINALLDQHPVATRFVMTMNARPAFDLVEIVLHHNVMPYCSKAKLLKMLQSINPDQFTVSKDQIPTQILDELEAVRQRLQLNPPEEHLPMSSEDVQLFQKLYPEPLHEFATFPKYMRIALKRRFGLEANPNLGDPFSADLMAKAVPALARLGIRIPLSDFVAHGEFAIQLYPHLTLDVFWYYLSIWLIWDGPAKQSLHKVSGIMLQLLSIPSFIRELEHKKHADIFQRFLEYLHSEDREVYDQISAHNIQHRKAAAIIREVIDIIGRAEYGWGTRFMRYFSGAILLFGPYLNPWGKTEVSENPGCHLGDCTLL